MHSAKPCFQFELPEAVTLLRDTRRMPRAGGYVSVSGADSLNLAGIVVPGPKIPTPLNNRVLYPDGSPVERW